MNGAGEMLVFSAADFEDFLEPRPDLPAGAGRRSCPRVVRLLAENRWPFRLHATYDESITRFLDVFEAVNRDVPFDGLRWFFDHAETVTERNLERIKALGGGIAVQHRMAYQGEYFVDRYGAEGGRADAARSRRMLEMGIPVGGGDRRHAGRQLQPVGLAVLAGHGQDGRRHCRCTPRRTGSTGSEALRLYTPGSRVVLGRGGREGVRSTAGQLADLAVLSADYFSVPEEEHQGHRVGADGGRRQGRVRGRRRSPGSPRRRCRSCPDWSPVGVYGGYHRVAVRSASRPASPRPAARPRDGRPPVTGSADARRRRAVMGRRAADAGRSEDRCLELVGGRGHDDSVEGIVRGRARRDPLRPRSGRTTRQAVKETSLAGPGGMKLTVRMQGPYDADVPAAGRLLLQAQGGGRHDPRRGGRAGQEARRRHRLAPEPRRVRRGRARDPAPDTARRAPSSRRPSS